MIRLACVLELNRGCLQDRGAIEIVSGSESLCSNFLIVLTNTSFAPSFKPRLLGIAMMARHNDTAQQVFGHRTHIAIRVSLQSYQIKETYEIYLRSALETWLLGEMSPSLLTKSVTSKEWILPKRLITTIRFNTLIPTVCVTDRLLLKVSIALCLVPLL
jgi:hypothetical protein